MFYEITSLTGQYEYYFPLRPKFIPPFGQSSLHQLIPASMSWQKAIFTPSFCAFGSLNSHRAISPPPGRSAPSLPVPPDFQPYENLCHPRHFWQRLRLRTNLCGFRPTDSAPLHPGLRRRAEARWDRVSGRGGASARFSGKTEAAEPPARV